MPFKIGHFGLNSLSYPCKRCLVFFEGKGRQAADTDPFPSRVGLLCASYRFLISAYLFSPSDLVQKQYIVEQVVIQQKLNFYFGLLLAVSSLFALIFPAAAFEKNWAKPPTSQNIKNKQIIVILAGLNYYCQNNSVWCIHAYEVQIFPI